MSIGNKNKLARGRIDMSEDMASSQVRGKVDERETTPEFVWAKSGVLSDSDVDDHYEDVITMRKRHSQRSFEMPGSCLDDVPQLPAVRSPLKDFQEKVGKDSGDWERAYNRVKSALNYSHVAKEIIQKLQEEVEEVSMICKGSPTAAALLVPGLDSLSKGVAQIRGELDAGTENFPAASLCNMRNLYMELCKDAAVCKVQQTSADHEIETIKEEVDRLNKALEDSNAKLLQAQMQVRMEKERHESEKMKWEGINAHNVAKRKAHPVDNVDPPLVGSKKRRNVRRLDSDPEEAVVQSDMEWQPERWERRRRQGQPQTENMFPHRVTRERKTYRKERQERNDVNIKKKGPRERLLPAALIVRANEGTTYAEVLKKVKEQECLQEVEVTSARKTAAGFLLLQFARETTPGEIDRVREDMAKVMGSAANVSSAKRKKTVQIEDVDELTSREALEEVLKKAIPGCDHKLVSLRQGFGGAQRAIIRCVDCPELQKIVAAKRIKIGFLSCRVRVLPSVVRCFRCHLLGHVAAQCSLDQKIKELCRKCGARDHVMKDCVNTPRCQVCTGKGMPEAKARHVTAAAACPILRAL